MERSEETQFSKKNVGGPNLGKNRQKGHKSEFSGLFSIKNHSILMNLPMTTESDDAKYVAVVKALKNDIEPQFRAL